ncbi:MAG: hypothetical protein CM15mP62_20470 [Rhodospirillaceae bacterium]|nr:MAG: hypothetical protein CM15mP62_20470 [Rhodospirillaceae bacterium]
MTVSSFRHWFTKTCCFIARVENFKNQIGNNDLPKLSVLGIGHKASEGVKGGAIVDMEASEISIRRAVQAAETMAKETMGQCLCESFWWCSHLSFTWRGSIDKWAPHSRCRLRHYSGQGKTTHIDEGSELIHLFPIDFCIDGHRGIKDPRGMSGQTCPAKMHMVTALSGPIRNSTVVVEGAI